MAAFSGASMASVTLEDAIAEIAYRLIATQADTAKNPTGADNVQVSISSNNSINISASLPSSVTIDAQGHPVINVTEYLS